MQNFWQKGIHSLFWIFVSRSQKMKNLTFWMELNTPMKILVFCISSFQSSWHFAFHGELNTALLKKVGGLVL
jgi:hypothetical protein